MTPIILTGPIGTYLEYPADHLDKDLDLMVGLEMEMQRYVTILIGAASPLPLAVYWDSLLTRIADTYPDRKVVILLRAPPCIEKQYEEEEEGFRLRARLATIPAMPLGFWAPIAKPEGDPVRRLCADGSLL